MNVNNFQEKYGAKGGIAKLTEFRSMLYSLDYTAQHFGVSKARVRLWLLEFFGTVYDPRRERKETIILNMIDFAKNNPIEEFEFAFRGTEYYKETLERCKEQKIYDNA